MSSSRVILHRIALQCSPTRLGRSVATNNLADLLYTRFEEHGRISDLDGAPALYRKALELHSRGSRDRALLLGDIASCFHARALKVGTLDDLHEALKLYRDSLELLPQGDPDRALLLVGMANCLYDRSVELGTQSDLDEAITLHRETLQLCPQGHSDRAISLANIAKCLNIRFNGCGTLSDLDGALALERETLQLLQQGHSDRILSLCNIAQYLHSRFTQLGSLSDLDEAISLEREVLELRPKGRPDRASSLRSISRSLHIRFAQRGTLSDIDEALGLEREALELYPQDHPQRATSLDDIASHLHARFAKLGVQSDLDEALVLQHSVLKLRPQGHAYRAISLCSVADSLHTRFKHSGKLSDLDDALALYRDALGHFPPEHYYRILCLGNIATCLCARSTQFGTLSDLDEAVALAHEGLELCPQGHPNRASSLGTLGQCLHSRFVHSTTHDAKDLEEAFTVYSQLAAISHAVSLPDLQYVQQWIQVAEERQHATTVLAYQTLLRFSTYHLAALVSLPHDVSLLKKFTSSITLDALSACVRHGNYIAAVELLEQGRDVFWNQLFRLHSPLDEVMTSSDIGKELADKFTRLSTLLRRDVLHWPRTEPWHDQLDVQLQDVVADIRKLPGLSGFLLRPLFSDLRIAAAGGPVIILNASQYGCDALVVLPDRDPTHITLPITKSRTSQLSCELHSLTSRAKHDRENVAADLSALLRELRDVVVFPIIKVIQGFYPSGSRIWWYPTAEFSRLPLHATGSYSDGQLIFSDPYVFSYTSTLTALIRARRKTYPAYLWNANAF